MKWTIAVIAVMALVGCSNPAQDAERQYEIVRSSGADAQRLCEESRKVADAWLKQENAEKYQQWNARSGLDCNQALLDRITR